MRNNVEFIKQLSCRILAYCKNIILLLFFGWLVTVSAAGPFKLIYVDNINPPIGAVSKKLAIDQSITAAIKIKRKPAEPDYLAAGECQYYDLQQATTINDSKIQQAIASWQLTAIDVVIQQLKVVSGSLQDIIASECSDLIWIGFEFANEKMPLIKSSNLREVYGLRQVSTDRLFRITIVVRQLVENRCMPTKVVLYNTALDFMSFFDLVPAKSIYLQQLLHTQPLALANPWALLLTDVSNPLEWNELIYQKYKAFNLFQLMSAQEQYFLQQQIDGVFSTGYLPAPYPLVSDTNCGIRWDFEDDPLFTTQLTGKMELPQSLAFLLEERLKLDGVCVPERIHTFQVLPYLLLRTKILKPTTVAQLIINLVALAQPNYSIFLEKHVNLFELDAHNNIKRGPLHQLPVAACSGLMLARICNATTSINIFTIQRDFVGEICDIIE